MAEQMSKSLCNALMDTDCLKTIIDGNWKLYIFGYTGAVVAPPTTASAATTGSVVLCTVANAGAEVNMDTAAVDGVLGKDTGETWSGTNAFTGTATFYRFQDSGDDNGVDNGDGTRPRIQGTIGTGGTDLVVGSVSLTAAAPFAINYWTQAIVPS